jgi:hypothetical protein
LHTHTFTHRTCVHCDLEHRSFLLRILEADSQSFTVSMHAPTPTPTQTRTHTLTKTQTYAHKHSKAHTHTHANKHPHLQAHTHTYTLTSAHEHTHAHAHLHAHAYAHTHTHVHTLQRHELTCNVIFSTGCSPALSTNRRPNILVRRWGAGVDDVDSAPGELEEEGRGWGRTAEPL